MQQMITTTYGNTALLSPVLESTIENWVSIHYGDHAFHGRVMIGSRKPGKAEIYQVSANDISILSDVIREMKLYKRDYYITANTMNGVNRQLEGLFSLNNIVIDVDCHTEDYLPTELLQEFKYRLYRDVIDENEIPEPNSIVWTGRGLQLWWAIKPVSVKCKAYYQSITGAYINRIRTLLDEYPDTLQDLQIDYGASNNAVGWFRFPESYNTSSETYGLLEINHSRIYDTHELRKTLPIVISKPVVKVDTQGHAEVYELQNLYTLANERLKQMKKLQTLRSSEYVGSRDLIMFIIYNSLICAGSSDEEAMDVIRKVNQDFSKPMTERELRQLTSSSRKKGGYPISNTWIIQNLDISEAEQVEIGIYERQEPWKPIKERTPNFSRDLHRKIKKEKRDEEIIKWAGFGRTDKEIAEKVGCSINTVRNVLKGSVNKKAERTQRIHTLKSSGKTQKEVSEIMNISLRTVKNYWNS